MSVALKSVEWQKTYPMDFYANDSLGAWTVNNEQHRPVKPRKQRVKKTHQSKTTSTCDKEKEQSKTTSDDDKEKDKFKTTATGEKEIDQSKTSEKEINQSKVSNSCDIESNVCCGATDCCKETKS